MNNCFRKQAAARYVSFGFFFVLENKLDKKMNKGCRKQAAATELFFSFLLEKTWQTRSCTIRCRKHNKLHF
jgi:hypothetical protein